MELFSLVVAAFFAGFVDSIAGGGGLIQLPALFIFLPPAIASNIGAVMGTNKFASICGTTVAAYQYSRQVRFNARIITPASIAAFVFSFLGARAVTLLDPRLIKPALLVLLIAVSTFTYLRKSLGQRSEPRVPHRLQPAAALALGAAIGFYDGFFGPGTGTFLVLGGVLLFGFDFLQASASAKFINLITNLGAVLWFGWNGSILYSYALPMAAANILGAALGARLAILKGNSFIRRFFLALVLLLVARFAYELLLQPK